MDSLPPIPTPPSQRWRDFRIQTLPVLVFALICTAIALLWREVVIPSSIVGEVETVTNIVASVQAGTISQLAVDRFASVTKGQVLGQVVIARPEVVQATLRAIAADLENAGTRMEAIEWNRAQSFEQLQLGLLNAKVLLAIAQPSLVEAEAELKRNQELTKGDKSVVSQAALELAIAKRDRLQAEVTQRKALIEYSEKAIGKLQASQVFDSATNGIARQIAADQAQFEATQKPITLVAPIDGVVTRVSRHAGDTVMAGEPILTITTPPTRIIGYLPSPARVIPKIGDTVEIRTRTLKRQMEKALVVQVGTHYEPFDTSLISPNMNLKERALTFQISLPPNLKVLPGEVVDLSLRFTK